MSSPLGLVLGVVTAVPRVLLAAPRVLAAPFGDLRSISHSVGALEEVVGLGRLPPAR